MLAKIITNIAGRPKFLPNLYLERAFCHSIQDFDEKLLSSDWYRAAYGMLIKLTRVLKNVEQIDGRIINSADSSIITDEHIIGHMQSFNSLAKAFIGERKSMTLNSLTKVCNLLNITAQQRKNVRLTVCPQVTQHHIWKGALEEVLRNLKHEIDAPGPHSPSLQMGEQILSSCLKFFSDTTLSDAESPSWMKPAPLRKVEKPTPSRMWEEVLEMFIDLTKSLETEERLASYVSKLEVMKEGLYPIRDIVIERDVSYKEVKRQDCLVQRNLSKNLGHSSKCLFTLLLYYLYGNVRDIEVEVCGGVRVRDDRSCVHIGKILTSCDEGMVMNGVRQLSKALGVFKFVWETAGLDGVLELQGHLWCVGAEERRIAYRGNVFFLHGIRL